MPLPTNEPEHLEDWRPFMGYTDVDGCVVILFFFGFMNICSGNLKLVLWLINLLRIQNFLLIKKVILGIYALSASRNS
jgi:hypothetical protein